MAQENYPVDKKIKFGYQAPNAESDLDIRADIYRPNEDIFEVDIPLHEVKKTGTYRGEFTPDKGTDGLEQWQGEWQVVMYKFIGSGERDSQVTKSFSVGAHSVSDVGVLVADVDSDVVALDEKVDIVDVVVDGLDIKADTTHTKLNTVEAKIDTIGGKVEQLDTPPMAF